jgi:hypothetical protein
MTTESFWPVGPQGPAGVCEPSIVSEVSHLQAVFHPKREATSHLICK